MKNMSSLVYIDRRWIYKDCDPNHKSLLTIQKWSTCAFGSEYLDGNWKQWLAALIKIDRWIEIDRYLLLTRRESGWLMCHKIINSSFSFEMHQCPCKKKKCHHRLIEKQIFSCFMTPPSDVRAQAPNAGLLRDDSPQTTSGWVPTPNIAKSQRPDGILRLNAGSMTWAILDT